MLYRRSYTDPLVNISEIGSLNSPEAIYSFLAHKKFPTSTLPLFLHETTHHFCFNSPIGRALTLQYCLLCRNVFRQSSRKSRSSVEKEFARYDTVLNILRPLAEGLALFAEHDVWPGHTDTISSPAIWGSLLYKIPFENFRSELLATRLTSTHIKRKASLLLTGLIEREGAYLAGYLAVKNVWTHLVPISRSFADRDFFLHYLTRFFYDDWGTIPSMLANDDGEAFSLALFRRFDQILSIENITTSVPMAEGRLAKSQLEHFLMPQVIENLSLGLAYLPIIPSDKSEVGKSLFSTLARTAFGPLKPAAKHKCTEEELTLRWADLATYLAHDVLTIAHAILPATVVGSRLEIRHEGKILYSEPLIEKLPDDWVGEVNVNVLGETRRSFRIAILVSVGEKTVSSKILFSSGDDLHDELEPENVKDALRFFQNREFRVQFASIRRELAREVRLISEQKIASAHLFTNNATKFYMAATFLFLPIDQTERTFSAMSANGVCGLLNNDLSLLTDAAVASLAAPLQLDVSELDRIPTHQWSMGSAEKSIEKINLLLEPWLGVRPFGVIDGRLLLSSI